MNYHQGGWSRYRKILIPLDGSAEAEGVLPMVRGLVTAESEAVLFQVISASRSRAFGEYTVRREAIRYLRQALSKLGETEGQWRCEAAVSASAADGIVEFASREEVDLIAMCAHDRKGLSKLMKGNVTEKVRKKTATEAQVFKPGELVTAG